MKNKKAFTLLEIIIVIIIIGVLASLALPRLFSVVEYSRSSEAMVAFTSIRASMERCYLMNNGSYSSCNMDALDIPDPTSSPNSHFEYSVFPNDPVDGGYSILIRRNTRDGGDWADTIWIVNDGTKITKTGYNNYSSIK